MSENPYARDPYPAPSLTPDQERTWALGTHVVAGAATVVSAGTLGFVAALIVYLMYRDRGPFLRHHAANAINIQLNALLWAVVIAILGVLTLGLGWFLFAVIPVVMVVLHTLGALAANRGEWSRPPLTVTIFR